MGLGFVRVRLNRFEKDTGSPMGDATRYRAG